MADTRVNPQTADAVPLDPPKRREFYPIDNSVNAPRLPSPDSYTQFTQALAQLNPKLTQLTNDSMQQEAASESTAARQQAIKTGLVYNEAVSRGLVPPDQGPYFAKAWNEIDGTNAADTAANTIRSNYATDPINNSADPAAQQQWLTQQISSAAQGVTDPFAAQAFASRMQAHHASLTADIAQHVTANSVYGMQSSVSTMLGNTIDSAVGDAKNSGQPLNADTLGQTLASNTLLPKFAGLDKKTTDTLLVQAVIDKAKQYGDPALLDALSSDRTDIHGNSLGSLGNIGAVQGQIIAAKREIMQQKALQNTQAYDQWERSQKVNGVAALQKVNTELQATGTVSNDSLTALNKANPEMYKDAIEAIEARRKVNDYIPPEQQARVWTELRTGDYGTDANGQPVDATAWANHQVATHQFSGSASDVDKFLQAAAQESQEPLNKYDSYRRDQQQLGNALSDPMLGKYFQNPQDRINAGNLLEQNMRDRVTQMRAAGTLTGGNVDRAESEEMQKVLDLYKAKQGDTDTPAAPKSPETKAADLSPAGTPKATRVSPADQKTLKQQFIASPADKMLHDDIVNKYAPDAIARDLPWFK